MPTTEPSALPIRGASGTLVAVAILGLLVAGILLTASVGQPLPADEATFCDLPADGVEPASAATPAAPGGEVATPVRTRDEPAPLHGDLRLLCSPHAAELLAQPLCDAFQARQRGIRVEVRTVAEHGYLDALLTGDADLVVVSRPLAPSETRLGLQQRTLGHRLLVPIVHEANPVRSVRYSELLDLLAGRIATWQPLGWDAVPVQPAVGQRLGAQDPELFLEQAVERAAVLRSGADIVAFVGNTPGALAVVPFATAAGSPRVRELAVDGVAPGPDAFARGAWRLGRSYFLVFDGNERPILDPAGRRGLLVTAFATFLQTADARRILDAKLVVPR